MMMTIIEFSQALSAVRRRLSFHPLEDKRLKKIKEKIK